MSVMGIVIFRLVGGGVPTQIFRKYNHEIIKFGSILETGEEGARPLGPPVISSNLAHKANAKMKSMLAKLSLKNSKDVSCCSLFLLDLDKNK